VPCRSTSSASRASDLVFLSPSPSSRSGVNSSAQQCAFFCTLASNFLLEGCEMDQLRTLARELLQSAP
jgi:hypothetical protein